MGGDPFTQGRAPGLSYFALSALPTANGFLCFSIRETEPL